MGRDQGGLTGLERRLPSSFCSSSAYAGLAYLLGQRVRGDVQYRSMHRYYHLPVQTQHPFQLVETDPRFLTASRLLTELARIRRGVPAADVLSQLHDPGCGARVRRRVALLVTS